MLSHERGRGSSMCVIFTEARTSQLEVEVIIGMGTITFLQAFVPTEAIFIFQLIRRAMINLLSGVRGSSPGSDGALKKSRKVRSLELIWGMDDTRLVFSCYGESLCPMVRMAFPRS